MVHCSESISGIWQPPAGLSSAETDPNGEHAVMHKLLRFYTFRMSVGIVPLPEPFITATVIFYLFITSSCWQTSSLFASIFLLLRESGSANSHLHFLYGGALGQRSKADLAGSLKVAGYDNSTHNKAAVRLQREQASMLPLCISKTPAFIRRASRPSSEDSSDHYSCEKDLRYHAKIK